MRSTYAVLGFVFLFCNYAMADNAFFAANGKSGSIKLPEGMCDITETGKGAIIASFLEERSRTSGKAMPRLELVLADCSNPSAGYPWGWVGVAEEDATGLAQSLFNRYISRQLESLIAEVSAQIGARDALQEFEQSSGVRIDGLENGKPLILESNNDAFIFALPQSATLNGEEVSEVILTSSMVRNGRLVHVYIYESQAEGASILRFSEELKKISKTLHVR